MRRRDGQRRRPARRWRAEGGGTGGRRSAAARQRCGRQRALDRGVCWGGALTFPATDDDRARIADVGCDELLLATLLGKPESGGGHSCQPSPSQLSSGRAGGGREIHSHRVRDGDNGGGAALRAPEATRSHPLWKSRGTALSARPWADLQCQRAAVALGSRYRARSNHISRARRAAAAGHPVTLTGPGTHKEALRLEDVLVRVLERLGDPLRRNEATAERHRVAYMTPRCLRTGAQIPVPGETKHARELGKSRGPSRARDLSSQFTRLCWAGSLPLLGHVLGKVLSEPLGHSEPAWQTERAAPRKRKAHAVVCAERHARQPARAPCPSYTP